LFSHAPRISHAPRKCRRGAGLIATREHFDVEASEHSGSLASANPLTGPSRRHQPVANPPGLNADDETITRGNSTQFIPPTSGSNEPGAGSRHLRSSATGRLMAAIGPRAPSIGLPVAYMRGEGHTCRHLGAGLRGGSKGPGAGFRSRWHDSGWIVCQSLNLRLRVPPTAIAIWCIEPSVRPYTDI